MGDQKPTQLPGPGPPHQGASDVSNRFGPNVGHSYASDGSSTEDMASDSDFNPVPSHRLKRKMRRTSPTGRQASKKASSMWSFTISYMPTTTTDVLNTLNRQSLSEYFERIAPGQVKEIRVYSRKNIMSVDVTSKAILDTVKAIVQLGNIPVRAFSAYDKATTIGVIYDVDEEITDSSLEKLLSSTAPSSSEDKAARRRARDAERKRRRRAEDAQLREREAAERHQRRAAAPDSAALKRKRRQEDPDFRKREAECKRRRREQYATPNARFKRDFLDRSFGHTCKVCDRLWFDNNLTRIGNIQNNSKALSVLCDTFGKGTDYADYVVCATCKQSLIAGRVPSASVSYGYRYPPRPEHLPELNAVEERLIAPRLPFMSIRHLTHGNGQYGIKGQIVTVPIQVPTVVRCLPRNIPDDAAIDVHIKRKLVSKSTYKHGLVKRSNIHAWLKHLENTPLYKHLNVQI
ncbi:uncharacterized protein LOC142794682 [Rhipicephalus microplus]|uniref:uncharacterized protein LOC142794682 n=1 Tax=Rhipicephalus microplus TaxID=6941 RepID=UPI003F6D4947